MKIRRVLAIAVLLAVPVWAQAQVVQQDGSRTDPGRTGTGSGMMIGGIDSDTLFRIPRYDASGNAQFSDVSRDRSSWLIWSNAINDTVSAPTQANILTTPFSAESTATLDVSTLRSVGLFLRYAPGAPVDTSQVYRFAVQVRAHPVQSQDSSSTYVWHKQMLEPVDAAGQDSIGHHVNSIAQTGAQTGEIIVDFSNKRYMPSAFRSWSGQTGIYFIVAVRDGSTLWAPYMSIRVRCIGPLAGPKPRIRVDVVGTPL